MGIIFFHAYQNFLYENRTININSLPSVYHSNGHYTEGYILMPINLIWEIMTINFFNALKKNLTVKKLNLKSSPLNISERGIKTDR